MSKKTSKDTTIAKKIDKAGPQNPETVSLEKSIENTVNQLEQKYTRLRQEDDRPLGTRVGPLYIPKKYLKPGYVQRWVTCGTHESNIERRLEQGYTVVRDNFEVGDESSNSALGEIVMKPANKQGTKLVLMEIPEDVYNQRRKEEHDKVDAIERQIKTHKSSKLDFVNFRETTMDDNS